MVNNVQSKNWADERNDFSIIMVTLLHLYAVACEN